MKGFKDIYLFKKDFHPKRTKRHAFYYTNQLMGSSEVEWAEQQVARVRSKRASLRSILAKRVRSADPFERGKKIPLPNKDNSFNDELWTRQWYLHDTSNIPTLPKLDLGIKEVEPHHDLVLAIKMFLIKGMENGLNWQRSRLYCH